MNPTKNPGQAYNRGSSEGPRIAPETPPTNKTSEGSLMADSQPSPVEPTDAREPFALKLYPDYDGTISRDTYRDRRERDYRDQRIAWLKQSRMGTARDADGKPLYTLTEGGCWSRTKPLSRKTRRLVLERDGHACVLCGATDRLEVDHIVRYIDGGSNEPENLRTLCYPCHGKRGGR